MEAMLVNTPEERTDIVGKVHRRRKGIEVTRWRCTENMEKPARKEKGHEV